MTLKLSASTARQRRVKLVKLPQNYPKQQAHKNDPKKAKTLTM